MTQSKLQESGSEWRLSGICIERWRSLRSVVWLVVLLGSVLTSRSELLFYEGFEYAESSTLAGQGSWVSTGGNLTVGGTSLGFGQLATSGGSVSSDSGWNSLNITTGLATPTTGVRWVSFVMIQTAGAATSWQGQQLLIGDAGGVTPGTLGNQMIRVGNAGANSPNPQGMATGGSFTYFNGGIAATFDTGASSATTSAQFFALKYDYDNTEITFYLDPTPGAGEASLIALGTVSAASNNLAKVHMSLAALQLKTNNIYTGSVAFDEIRIGETWSDVSPLSGTAPLAEYDWKPVRIGAGGLVTGMAIHPLDPEVRYARTDVGNGYRWDPLKSEWIPMLIRNVQDNTGLAAGLLGPPVITGVESLQVDPSDLDVVYMAFKLETSKDVWAQYPPSTGALYKSTDRGVTFNRTGLAIPMAPNGDTRAWGERIAVDPNNSDVVYYGSVFNGLQVSFDGAATWSQVEAGGPSTTADVINIVFDRRETLLVGGQQRSATVYAAVANGGVFRSIDGGVTWASITEGSSLDGFVRFMTIGPDGQVHVAKGGTKELWQFSNDAWTVRAVNVTWGTLTGIAVDQSDPKRIFTMSNGGSLSRTLDGGATWRSLGNEFLYANTLGWLPQLPDGFRSNGGVLLDSMNRLWSPQGNEGVLTYALSPDNSENGNPKVQWTIQSQGIEELVGHDVVIPPGSGDKPVISVHDASAFFIDDPDQFTAIQADELQDQLISNGIGLAYCPNVPSYVVVFSSDANRTSSGKNFSGYSADGGRTWTPFGSRPIQYRAGQIAVSRRDGWGLGADRIVILPSYGLPPKYSHDGGQTWNDSTGVALNSGGTMAEGGMINFSVRQRLLIADPFVANKFYLGSLSGNFYVSTDGGMTWSPRSNVGLAPGRFHSQMEANRTQQNDIWFVDGWEGAFAGGGVSAQNVHGLFRSTDGCTSFQRNPAVEYAICIALGAGSGLSGDAEFSVYFYGKLVDDPAWGIFRSVDEGQTWTRVAYFPAGIFDRPSMIAASWDTFGLLYVTTNGNSAVYGKPSFDAGYVESGYSRWRKSTFTSAQLNDPVLIGFEADPDEDGLMNFAEYALNRLPFEFEASPALSLIVDPASNTLEFVRAREEVTYIIERSFDLVQWTPLVTDPGSVSLSEPISYTLPIDLDQDREFYRLRMIHNE